MSMVGTIEDMRWEIKLLKDENSRLRRFIKDNKLIREFDDLERKRAMERTRANSDSREY
jgi:hypothetical protein